MRVGATPTLATKTLKQNYTTMTTTIDLFKFTAPATKTVRTLNDSRVYEQLVEGIRKALDKDACDESNTTYILVKVDNYTAHIEITFDAQWHRDVDWYDGGEWIATELTDITPIDVYKTYHVGDDEYSIDLELDVDRLWNMFNQK